MQREMKVSNVSEILGPWQMDASIWVIARSLGVDRNTLHKYGAGSVAIGRGAKISPPRAEDLGGDAYPILSPISSAIPPPVLAAPQGSLASEYSPPLP